MLSINAVLSLKTILKGDDFALLKKIITSLLLYSVIHCQIIISSALNTSAKSAVLIEAESLNVIFEQNAHQKLPMASTTKIMTAIVAIENSNISAVIDITDDMVGAEGSSIYLKAGEKLTLEQLLYALMLESANDAAEAIAISVGGSIEKFSEMMNQKAKELMLENTHFVNPHGLDDEEHYTTANDLAIIAAYALGNSLFSEIVLTRNYIIEESDYNSQRYLNNHNKLLSVYEGSIGVKTGFTKRCGRCLVSAAERNGVKLVAVTLSDPCDWNDHMAMLNYGFDMLENVVLAYENSLSFRLPVACGNVDSVAIRNKKALALTMMRNHPAIECRIQTKSGRFLFAPIEYDKYIADAVFFVGEEEIARIPLYTAEKVEITKSNNRFFS